MQAVVGSMGDDRVCVDEGAAFVDGFHWDETLLAALPTVRGVHVPALTDPAEALSSAPHFETDRGGEMRRHLQSLVSEKAVPAMRSLWTPTEAAEKISRDRLASSDAGFWDDLLWQCLLYDLLCEAPSPIRRDRRFLKWALQSAVALHGLPFALEALLALRFQFTMIRGPFARDVKGTNALVFLRHAIAAAAESDYRAALAVASRRRGRDIHTDCTLAYLFPEQTMWAEEGVAFDQPWERARWLSFSAMSPAAMLRHLGRYGYSIQHFLPAALLQLCLHGAAAVSTLNEGWALRTCMRPPR